MIELWMCFIGTVGLFYQQSSMHYISSSMISCIKICYKIMIYVIQFFKVCIQFMHNKMQLLKHGTLFNFWNTHFYVDNSTNASRSTSTLSPNMNRKK